MADNSKFTFADICNIPIDTEASRQFRLKQTLLLEPNEGKQTLLTSSTSVRSEVFVALWDLLDSIVRGTDWNKKARIVLEYDPHARKMDLFTFGSADEMQKMAGQ